MAAIVRVLIVSLGVCLLGSVGWARFTKEPPTRTQISWRAVNRAILVTRIRVDDKGNEVEEVVPDEQVSYVPIEVHLTSLEAVPHIEKVKSMIVLVIAVIYGVYAVAILALWARDKWGRKRESIDSRDTTKRVDALVTFTTGVIVGVLGATQQHDEPQVEVQPPPSIQGPLDSGTALPQNAPEAPAAPENAPPVR